MNKYSAGREILLVTGNLFFSAFFSPTTGEGSSSTNRHRKSGTLCRRWGHPVEKTVFATLPCCKGPQPPAPQTRRTPSWPGGPSRRPPHRCSWRSIISSAMIPAALFSFQHFAKHDSLALEATLFLCVFTLPGSVMVASTKDSLQGGI